MKATDKFKMYLNSIINKIDEDIHNELWNRLTDVIIENERLKSGGATIDSNTNEELNNALNKGGGIAQICCLVECPNCHDDIWINIGHHCGFDAVIDSVDTTDCYKCLNTVKFDSDIVLIQKGIKFMTISELHDIQFKNLK